MKINMKSIAKRTIGPLIFLSVLFALSIPASAWNPAAGTSGLGNVSGYVIYSDTEAAANGITVYNTSNSTQTTTTNSTGWYTLRNMSNGTGTLTFSATNGYMANTTVQFNVAGADNMTANGTMVIIQPLNSALTEASVTKTSVTVSWTANDSYSGNRLRYGLDSAFVGGDVYVTAWSNSTASPSFSLTNLQSNRKYYYRVETYNIANGSYSDLDTGDVTTLTAGTKSYWTPPKPASTVAKPKTQGEALVQTISSPDNRPKVIFFLVVIVAVTILYIKMNDTGGKGRRKIKVEGRGR